MLLPLLVGQGAFAGGVSFEQQLVEDLERPWHAQTDEGIVGPHADGGH